MNAKPKLQDTLEVFLEELEIIKNQLEESKKTLPMIEDRVREIKNSKIKVDLTELKYLQSNFNNDIVVKTSDLNKVLNEHLENTKKNLVQQKNDRTSFYLFSSLCFFISIIAVYFAITYYKDYHYLNKQFQSKERQLNTLKTYISDTQQENKFQSWYEKQ